MSFTNADLLAIKAELTNDPQGLGLTVLATDDEANANRLNAKIAGDSGFVKTLTVKKRYMTISDLFSAVIPSEWAVARASSSWLGDLLSLTSIDPFKNYDGIFEAAGGLNDLFPPQSESSPLLQAAIREPGSRIEMLFQAGTLSVDDQIAPSDVARARTAT